MNPESDYIQLLNNDLRIFFKDAVRVSVRHPLQALHFFRTVLWQRRASLRRVQHGKRGLHIPPIIIFSITNRCNLQCKGCYARVLHKNSGDELTDAELVRIIGEARDLGTSFFILAGGEPFLRSEILNVARRFKDALFLVFTNGLLLDTKMIENLRHMRNLVPVLSIEGHEEETDDRRGKGVHLILQNAASELQKAGIFYSISVTVTRMNLPIVLDKHFIQGTIAKGCKLFFFLEYTAIREGTESWVLTEEERTRLNDTIETYRKEYRSLFISIPGDEEKFGGCLSSGRGFLHITAQGDLEPCPFAPFSDINLKSYPLQEALQSRLLATIRENADQLEEGQGGCTLWQKKEWVESLLASTDKASEN